MNKTPGRAPRNHLIGNMVASCVMATMGSLATPLTVAAIPMGDGCSDRLMPLSESRTSPVFMYICKDGRGKALFWCESDLGTTRHGEVTDFNMCLEAKEAPVSGLHASEEMSVSYPNGIVYKGRGKGGVPNGRGTLTWNSVTGDKIEHVGNWLNARRAGEFTVYKNGQIEEISVFVDDKRNGRSTIFANGRATMSGKYQDGRREGDWTVIDSRDSRATAVQTYSGGKLLKERPIKIAGSVKRDSGGSTPVAGVKAMP